MCRFELLGVLILCFQDISDTIKSWMLEEKYKSSTLVAWCGR